MSTAVSWLPALLTASVAAVAGLLAATKLTKRHEETKRDLNDELESARERKEHAVAQLRDLEEQRDRMPEQAYAAQRDAFESEAAQSLREYDQLLEKLERQKVQNTHRAKTGSTHVALAVGATLALGWIVWGIANPLPATRPSTTTMRQSSDAAALPPQLAEIRRRLAENPADIEALLQASQLLLDRMQLDAAEPYVERALQLDPEHEGALVQYSALLLGRGMPERALAHLDEVTRTSPEYIEAWTLRAMVAMRLGRMGVARDSLQEYIARAPDGVQKDRVVQMLRSIGPQSPSPSGAPD